MRSPASGSIAGSVAKRMMRGTEEMRRYQLRAISFTAPALENWLITGLLLTVNRLIARRPQGRNSPLLARVFSVSHVTDDNSGEVDKPRELRLS